VIRFATIVMFDTETLHFVLSGAEALTDSVIHVRSGFTTSGVV
jgi:hypothetical protein